VEETLVIALWTGLVYAISWGMGYASGRQKGLSEGYRNGWAARKAQQHAQRWGISKPTDLP
jgi:type II secretory pathway pseudopilin PulG